MAGLIQQNMAAGVPTEQPGMAKAQMPNEQMPAGEMAEGEGPNPDTDPAYQQAIGLAMKALYGEQAAKEVAKSLKGGGDVVDAMANTAYEITSIIDERTEGAVPDELLVLLATTVLEEVGEIAEAAGMSVTPADTALALKQMILRFLGEQGVDTTQLEQAMSQVNPDDFNQMAMEVGAEQTEEEVPV